MSDETTLSEDERQRLAAALGLEKFARLFPEAFDRACAFSGTMQSRVPEPEGIADEPAHIFHASREAEA